MAKQKLKGAETEAEARRRMLREDVNDGIFSLICAGVAIWFLCRIWIEASIG